MMRDKYNISIVTVNYNSSKNINNLIKSLTIIKNTIKEIIIIDNNSKDIKDIHLDHKNIILIKNKSNTGFAKAANKGIKKAKSDYVLLINPDCYLENTSILKSIKYIIENKKIGAIGGKLKVPNSINYHLTANSKINFFTGLFEFTNLKKIFPNNVFSKMFWIENSYKGTKPIPVESLCGAYIIIRKKIGKFYNTFNEEYFLYLEDIEFGNKINKQGYKVIFDPRSEVTHIGGASNNSKYNTMLIHWYNSRRKYFSRHLSKIESTILVNIFKIEEIFLRKYHFITHTPNA